MYTSKMKYKQPEVDYQTVPESATVPDQSLSIEEIVSRFVRGLTSDVVQKQPVYIDQSEFDLEAMSRLDFAEKAALADELRARSEAIMRDLEEQKRSTEIEHERKEEERMNPKNPTNKARKKGSGIGSLDNTMPNDTDLDTK